MRAGAAMRSFSTDADETRGTAGGPAHDLFVTETMAELSARQGRTADAIAIYRRLHRRRHRRRPARALGAPARARSRARLVSGAAAAPAASVAALRHRHRAARAAGRRRRLPAPRAAPATAGRLPVRSGQIVYAEGRDLLVLAPVNPGAQLLADGHIHVYGPLARARSRRRARLAAGPGLLPASGSGAGRRRRRLSGGR